MSKYSDMTRTLRIFAHMAGENADQKMTEKDMLDVFKNLYDKVNMLVSIIGKNGSIEARSKEVDDVMQALHEIDGGDYKKDLLIKEGGEE